MDAAPLGKQFFVGDWLVEPAIDSISRGDERAKLEPRTMRLLVRIAQSPGEVLSAELLLNEVWAGVVVGPASVYQAVSQLRRVLGDTETQPHYIATVSRKGYRLVAPVKPAEAGLRPLSPDGGAPSAQTRVAAPPVIAVAARFGVGRWRLWAALGAALLTLAGGLWWYRGTREPAAPSIVVLPFVDMSSGKADQSFCDGLTEELSNWLAQVPNLRVVARTSAFAFKGQSIDVRKIGTQLGITHVLEGSMRRTADHMRVTVQLIDARSGYHLWSTDYDRPMADAISMQEEISRAVADNLEIRLTQNTSERFSARGTANPAAYQWYVLGLKHLQERSPEDNRQAAELFKQALAADPRFVPAYVGLGRAYLNERPLRNVPVAELGARIEPLLTAAEKLRPGLADVDALRGALLAEQGQMQAAEAALRRATQSNPNDSQAFAELGRVYLTAGRPRDALAEWSRAVLLNPLDYVAYTQRCVTLQDLSRFAEAAEDCARARDIKADAEWPYVASSWLAAAQGRLDEALRWNAEAIRREPQDASLYTSRADYYLSLGLPARGLERAERLRQSDSAKASINTRWASSAYVTGGAAALLIELRVRPVAPAPAGAESLLDAAYFELLLGRPSAAAEDVRRAEAAQDYDPRALIDPWYLRWGDSGALIVATVAKKNGDEAKAQKILSDILEAVDRLIAQGTDRHGVYELRAGVMALQGDGPRALDDLRHAARLGWRRSFWAMHEPQFELLWPRADFRALIAQVDAANSPLRRAVAAMP